MFIIRYLFERKARTYPVCMLKKHAPRFKMAWHLSMVRIKQNISCWAFYVRVPAWNKFTSRRWYWVKMTPSSCSMSFSSAGHATPREFNSHTPFSPVSIALKLVEAHRGFLSQCKPHVIKLGEENVLNMWPWRRRFLRVSTAREKKTDWLESTANNCLTRLLHSKIRKHCRILTDLFMNLSGCEDHYLW